MPLPLSLTEAAAAAGVTEKAIRSWIGRGLPVVQRGKQGRSATKTLIDRQALQTWLELRQSTGTQRARLLAGAADPLTKNRAPQAATSDVRQSQAIWDARAALASKCLLALPDLLAPQLVNLADPAEVAERIRGAVFAALDELAEY